MEKNPTIQTADFESAVRKLEKDIRETEHLTKTAVLRGIDELKASLIKYDGEDRFNIPSFLNKLP